MAKPRLLQRLHDLCRKKRITAYRMSLDLGIPLNTCQRMMQREDSPMLRNLEQMLDYAERAPAPPKKKGASGKATARQTESAKGKRKGTRTDASKRRKR